MELLDGKATSKHFKEQIRAETEAVKAQGGKTPHLAAVLVGDDPASHTYVNHKIKACREVGFESTLLNYDDDISESFLLEKVEELNHDPEIDGFIVQVPLPEHIDKIKVIQAVHYQKDVDGFHPVNIGRMAKNLPCFLPATPFGILKLLEHYEVPTVGKHCVIIGRSEIVGSPLSMLLARPTYPGNCTVTLTHRHTHDLSYFARQADILIAAVGRPGLVTADMVKEGAVVIDVGTTRVRDETKKKGFALKGDVAFDEVAPKCSFITPVPGGVGPMTIVSLLRNTLMASKGEVYDQVVG